MERVTSLQDFINVVSDFDVKANHSRVYRGHGDSSWKMLPRIFRDDLHKEISEKDLSRHAISRYPSEFDHEKSTFDTLTRLQHYNVPTRLLDVTQNPLAALFFACSSKVGGKHEPDACVVHMYVPEERRKFYDSDTVSCLSNLSNLTFAEQRSIWESSATRQAEFNELKAIKRLLQFIREEKPYFLPEIRRNDLFRPLVVFPKLRNPRIIAQQGAFIIYGLDKTQGPSYKRNIQSNKIYIDGDSKDAILSQLKAIGITNGNLFPEIDKLYPDLFDGLKAGTV